MPDSLTETKNKQDLLVETQNLEQKLHLIKNFFQEKEYDSITIAEQFNLSR